MKTCPYCGSQNIVKVMYGYYCNDCRLSFPIPSITRKSNMSPKNGGIL